MDSLFQILNSLSVLLEGHTARIVDEDDNIEQTDFDEISGELDRELPSRRELLQRAGLGDSLGDLVEGLGVLVESLEVLLRISRVSIVRETEIAYVLDTLLEEGGDVSGIYTTSTWGRSGGLTILTGLLAVMSLSLSGLLAVLSLSRLLAVLALTWLLAVLALTWLLAILALPRLLTVLSLSLSRLLTILSGLLTILALALALLLAVLALPGLLTVRRRLRLTTVGRRTRWSSVLRVRLWLGSVLPLTGLRLRLG